MKLEDFHFDFGGFGKGYIADRAREMRLLHWIKKVKGVAGMHILLAEDDETLGELIVHLLKKKGRGQGSVKKTKRCCKAAVNHEGRLAFPACRWYK